MKEKSFTREEPRSSHIDAHSLFFWVFEILQSGIMGISELIRFADIVSSAQSLQAMKKGMVIRI